MSKPIVAIQGQEHSYHDIARRQYFKNGHELLYRDDFKDIFADVNEGRADYAVVAIENSLYGSINQVYDLLLKHKLWITGEIYLRIHHCLLGLEEAQLKDIHAVHSHPLALAQSEDFLDDTLPQAERFEHHDTAGSAADVAQWGDTNKAAIASRQAAEAYGLNILARGIETNPQNYTRFIVLQSQPPDQPSKTSTRNSKHDKSSIILYTAHQPGALHRALGVFADLGINLSKLESRPIIGRAWHYMFYIDFDAGLQSEPARQAVQQLQNLDNDVIELGSYRQGTVVE